jgi:APA family basic amino acid/polyamine antiporter
VLRKKRPDMHRAFRCPGVPVVPILAVVFCVALMTFLSKTTWMAFVIWLVLGLVIYFTYARRNSRLNRE